VGYGYVLAMKDAGRWVNIEAMLAQPEVTQKVWADTELLDARGHQTRPGRGLGEHGTQYTVTEVWTFMRLPRSAYVEGENWKLPVPVRIVLAGDEPVEVTRNPFFHQRPPY